jgi:hypothetical protein
MKLHLSFVVVLLSLSFHAWGTQHSQTESLEKIKIRPGDFEHLEEVCLRIQGSQLSHSSLTARYKTNLYRAISRQPLLVEILRHSYGEQPKEKLYEEILPNSNLTKEAWKALLDEVSQAFPRWKPFVEHKLALAKPPQNNIRWRRALPVILEEKP